MWRNDLMRICTISHSHIALRQQLFFKEVAKQGHDVLMISPGEWGNLKAKVAAEVYSTPMPNGFRYTGRWELKTCRTMFPGDIYAYHLFGAQEIAEAFNPDWLYIQAEPGSSLAEEAVMWKVNKRALFTWENIQLKGGLTSLGKYDLVVCGNPEAEALVKPYSSHTLLSLQVGVDTDHFQVRPQVLRDVAVAYIGRPSPEKGLPYLGQAWPGVKVMDWAPFEQMPWMYSQVQVVVAFSQDVPFWKEQAPNYVVLEALSCGCKAVTSNTAAMAFWLEGCPGVVMVEGHDQPDGDLRLERVYGLIEGIRKALSYGLDYEGRQWVVSRFGNPVVARQLIETFQEVEVGQRA